MALKAFKSFKSTKALFFPFRAFYSGFCVVEGWFCGVIWL